MSGSGSKNDKQDNDDQNNETDEEKLRESSMEIPTPTLAQTLQIEIAPM